VMSMIIAHEWIREVEASYERAETRDPENDAEEAFAVDEKIYG
jgi:hypothetical protein